MVRRRVCMVSRVLSRRACSCSGSCTAMMHRCMRLLKVLWMLLGMKGLQVGLWCHVMGILSAVSMVTSPTTTTRHCSPMLCPGGGRRRRRRRRRGSRQVHLVLGSCRTLPSCRPRLRSGQASCGHARVHVVARGPVEGHGHGDGRRGPAARRLRRRGPASFFVVLHRSRAAHASTLS